MTHAQAKTLFRILFVPMVLLYISLAFPLLGFITFKHLSHPAVADCVRSAEGLLKSCEVNGIDVALVEGLYIFSTFLLGIPYPLVAFLAIPVLIPRILLIGWAAGTFWTWRIQRKLKPDA